MFTALPDPGSLLLQLYLTLARSCYSSTWLWLALVTALPDSGSLVHVWLALACMSELTPQRGSGAATSIIKHLAGIGVCSERELLIHSYTLIIPLNMLNHTGSVNTNWFAIYAILGFLISLIWYMNYRKTQGITQIKYVKDVRTNISEILNNPVSLNWPLSVACVIDIHNWLTVIKISQ